MMKTVQELLARLIGSEATRTGVADRSAPADQLGDGYDDDLDPFEREAVQREIAAAKKERRTK